MVPPLGSFEEWASTVGSVLAFAGIEGFLGNLDQTQVAQDEDTQQWTAFFDAWWDAFGSIPVTVDDLCQRLIEEDVQGARSARAPGCTACTSRCTWCARGRATPIARTAPVETGRAHLQRSQAVTCRRAQPSQSPLLEAFRDA
jgi:hypothetical protein